MPGGPIPFLRIRKATCSLARLSREREREGGNRALIERGNVAFLTLDRGLHGLTRALMNTSTITCR